MENQRTLKQNYLVDNIINMGYDSNDFENFVMQASNNSDGLDIDAWTLEQLQEVILTNSRFK